MIPDDTIVAPATPVGRSALAIVRLDGPAAPEIARNLTGLELEERLATFVRIGDGQGAIDEAVAIRYAAPRSFTGNDLVEFTVHGSPLIVQRVLGAALAAGARMAEPGEFTERAVLNGKLDLVQAEAVADLIASRTGLQAKLALSNLEGALSREADAIREALVSVLSRFEAALDFADEGYEFIGRDEAATTLREAMAALARLEATFLRGRATAAGVTLVILGRPNAGKSTLLNFLAGRDRAIVTDIPGTTRDLLHETIEIGGLPVTVIDTAGLRATGDAVETIGIARAREAARGAEIVLYLVDAAAGETAEDRAALEEHPDAIVVYSKSDLADAPAGSLSVSITSGSGVADLLALLDGLVRERFAVPEGSVAVVTERQQSAIREAASSLGAALESLAQNASEEVVAVDLRAAARSLGVLTGAITTDELLASIFEKFCIGK